MKNIIIIADERYSDMVERSIRPDVNVKLYLQFDGFYMLSKEEQEQEKLMFLNEVNTCLAENNYDIEYAFCFIQNTHLHKEELADWNFTRNVGDSFILFAG